MMSSKMLIAASGAVSGAARCKAASSLSILGSVRTVAGRASAMTAPSPPPTPATSGTPGFERDPEEIRRMNRTGEESIYKLGKHRSNAMELVHKIPIIEVDGDMAICDGGGGALGHPLEYIALRPGVVEYCKYCSLRYTAKQKH